MANLGAMIEMKILKNVLLTLGPTSDEICIQTSSICMDNQYEFRKIFHPKLKIFEFDHESKITLSDKINEDQNAGNSDFHVDDCLEAVVYGFPFP